MADPFPQVAGGGLAELRQAGLQVDVGCGAAAAARLNAPYLKLVSAGRPWVIAKWAMTLDGKLASRTGDSRWISGAAARQIVHELRGRVDAILIGRGTATADDPQLTARPPGPRVATRIVADRRALLSTSSRLVQTAAEAPVLIAAGPEARPEDVARLEAAGCEVFRCPGSSDALRIEALLQELGRRRMTNVLAEGGSRLLGALFDAQRIDEVHAFIALRLLGGGAAPGPLAGLGAETLAQACRLGDVEVSQLEGDVYVRGIVE
jgi:diaminohydroxyphosphoribosylaminopyrimidine deaminase/5-amino-6-(5-phosphoribosylamino)uracil reductase